MPRSSRSLFRPRRRNPAATRNTISETALPSTTPPDLATTTPTTSDPTQNGNENNNTALQEAAAKGQLTAVREWIETAGASVHASNRVGCTPLHLAAAGGHLDVVRYLVNQAGANMYATNIHGHSPAAVAKVCEQGAVVQFFKRTAATRTPRGQQRQEEDSSTSALTESSSRGTEEEVIATGTVRTGTKTSTTRLVEPPSPQPAKWQPTSPVPSRKLLSNHNNNDDDTTASRDLSVDDFLAQAAAVSVSSRRKTAHNNKKQPSGSAAPCSPRHHPTSRMAMNDYDASADDTSIDAFVAQGMQNGNATSVPPSPRQWSPAQKQQQQQSSSSLANGRRRTTIGNDHVIQKDETSIADFCAQGIEKERQSNLSPHSHPVQVPSESKIAAGVAAEKAKPRTNPLRNTPNLLSKSFSSSRNQQHSLPLPSSLVVGEVSRGISTHDVSVQDLGTSSNQTNTSLVSSARSLPPDCGVGILLDDGTVTADSLAVQEDTVTAELSQVSSITMTFQNDDAVSEKATTKDPSVGTKQPRKEEDEEEPSRYSNASENHDLAMAFCEQDMSNTEDLQDVKGASALYVQTSLDSSRIQALLQHGSMLDQEETRVILNTPHAGFFLSFCRKTLDMLSFCAHLLIADGLHRGTMEEQQVRIQSLIDDASAPKTSAAENSSNATSSFFTLVAELGDDDDLRLAAVTKVVTASVRLAENGHLQRAVVRFACHLVRVRAEQEYQQSQRREPGSVVIGEHAPENLFNLVRRKRFCMFRRLSQSLHALSSEGMALSSPSLLVQEMLQVDTWAREEGHVATDIAMDILLRHDRLGSSFANGTDHFVDLWALVFTGLSSVSELLDLPRITAPPSLPRQESVGGSELTTTTMTDSTLHLCQDDLSRADKTTPISDDSHFSSETDEIYPEELTASEQLQSRYNLGQTRNETTAEESRNVEADSSRALSKCDELNHSAAREELRRLFSEEDLSWGETDKDAMLLEMQALIEEQERTILQLQKKLEHEHDALLSKDSKRKSLSEMKRNALTEMWERHQDDLKLAQLSIMVGTKNAKKYEKKGDKRMALAWMDKDSLTKLWKQHQKAQESIAWKYI